MLVAEVGGKTHLEKLDRSGTRPTHFLLDIWQQLADFVILINEDFPLSEERLARAVEPLEENHDRHVVGVGVKLQTMRQLSDSDLGAWIDCHTHRVEFGMIRVVVKIQSQISRTSSHVISNVLHT